MPCHRSASSAARPRSGPRALSGGGCRDLRRRRQHRRPGLLAGRDDGRAGPHTDDAALVVLPSNAEASPPRRGGYPLPHFFNKKVRRKRCGGIAQAPAVLRESPDIRACRVVLARPRLRV